MLFVPGIYAASSAAPTTPAIRGGRSTGAYPFAPGGVRHASIRIDAKSTHSQENSGNNYYR